MRTKRLGRHGPEVSAIGLGCMAMSGSYGPADRRQSIATIHRALEAGITLFDTGDFYGMGHNELLLAEALQGGRRERALLSVKFGALRRPDGTFVGFDARPESVKNFAAYTLTRLGTDRIDIYRSARVDPTVPIEETVGAIADLIRAGHVRYAGLSEASAETVRRAHAAHPIADLQIEYSLISRGVEREILPALRELGIGLTAYGVLSRGLISEEAIRGEPLGGGRARMPRFEGENLRHNISLVERLDAIAAVRKVSVSQLAIAWAAAQGDDIVPLVGARRPDRIDEAVAALEFDLAEPELKALEAALPAERIAGERYASDQMAMLDSERR